jgi:hypothetical protein
MNITALKSQFINYLQNEDIKRELRELMRPVVKLVYNEFFFYICLFCIYNVILLCLLCSILVLQICRGTPLPH